MALSSARYHRARDKTLRAVDRVMSEPIEFFPQLKDAPDSSRDKVKIDAVLRVNIGRERGPTGGVSGSWNSKVEAGKSELSIDRVKYPNIVAKTGDRICALSRPGQPFFQVEHSNDRGETRLILELSEK